ncbi:MAG: hypothetical protein PUI37_09025, partial [Oscillospiraceae bacterium]|nr:hypothetical protein [Oscillospiraceae bacterium]
EIEQLINELDFIDERDQEILGSKDEAEKQMEVLSSKKNGCPNCGFVCDSNANFCRKCGNKL